MEKRKWISHNKFTAAQNNSRIRLLVVLVEYVVDSFIKIKEFYEEIYGNWSQVDVTELWSRKRKFSEFILIRMHCFVGSLTLMREELTDWMKFWRFLGKNFNFLIILIKANFYEIFVKFRFMRRKVSIRGCPRRWLKHTTRKRFWFAKFSIKGGFEKSKNYNIFDRPLNDFISKEFHRKPFQRNMIFPIDFQIKAACLNRYRRYTPKSQFQKREFYKLQYTIEAVKSKGKQNYQFGGKWLNIHSHSLGSRFHLKISMQN